MLSCNSVYFELVDFFFLIIVLAVINEVAIHNSNNPRNFDKHPPMFMSSKLFHNIPVFSCFFMKLLSVAFGFC